MKLSAKASYAIRALAELAKFRPQDWVKSRDLARKISISPDFLAQIILDLRKAGLVQSQRGKRGGIRLAKSPSEINLRQIIEAVEGKIALKKCLEDEKACAFYQKCPLVEVVRQSQEKLLEVYEKKTLEEMVKRYV